MLRQESLRKGSGPAAQFGVGNDGLAPSTAYAGASGRGGAKGVLADYRLAQQDLQRRRERAALERAHALHVMGTGVVMEGPSVAFDSDHAKEARAGVLKVRGLQLCVEYA